MPRYAHPCRTIERPCALPRTLVVLSSILVTHETSLRIDLAHVIGRRQIQDARQTVNGGVEHAKARKIAIGPLGIDHLHIERATRLERARWQTERLGAARRGKPERLNNRHARALAQSTAFIRRQHRIHARFKKARNEYRLANILIHARAIAARDIGTKTHMNTLLTEALDRRHRAREIRIRHRAMGNCHTQLGEHLALFLRDIRAMRHDRALVYQAEIAKRIRVGFSKTLQHHIVLPLALVAVGLHVGARRSRKVAKAAQHFIGATWNEARRDNWPNALLARAANGFDFLNKRRRVTHSLRTARTGQMLYPVGFFDLAFEDVQQYDIDGVTVTQRQNAGRITGISWTREGYEYLLYSLQPEMNMIAGLAVEFVTNTRAEAVV